MMLSYIRGTSTTSTLVLPCKQGLMQVLQGGPWSTHRPDEGYIGQWYTTCLPVRWKSLSRMVLQFRQPTTKTSFVSEYERQLMKAMPVCCAFMSRQPFHSPMDADPRQAIDALRFLALPRSHLAL